MSDTQTTMGFDMAPARVSGEAGHCLPGRGFLRQYELVERVLSYQSDADEDGLNRAYVFAMVRHGEQKRHSGDPFFAHPVAVAGLLTDLRLDQNTIIAGLLHDTVEDTGTSSQEIREKFGDTVADLVDGVTKLPHLSHQSRRAGQAENFQKFILAMARDIRVLLVKLADRLHNMRTLSFVPRVQSRQRIARETMDIYAPLAHRIGLSVLAEELEDLAFGALEPDACRAIEDHLHISVRKSRETVASVCSILRARLDDAGVAAAVSGRIKRPYSIWRKLERKSVELGDIGDIFAFRLIAPDEDACYRVLGLVHRTWPTIQGGFKDYISVPKRNGYQSLHTVVSGLHGRRVELQIRTPHMQQIAERGIAAHWRYKNAEYGFDSHGARASGIDVQADLTALADMIGNGASPEEYFEHARMELYRESVFVRTPGGRLVRLPSGAMPLDFAYAVHSRIGDTCTGARINGAQCTLSTRLKNGDVVEILRGNRAVPDPDRQELVVTGRAKSNLHRVIRARRRQEKSRLGRALLARELEERGLSIADTDMMKHAVRRAGYTSLHGLIFAVAEGKMSAAKAIQAAFPDIAHADPQSASRLRDPVCLTIGTDLTVGVSVSLAGCCWPVPGDSIVGVLSPDTGVDAHGSDCTVLDQAGIDPGTRISLVWEKSAHQLARARILVTTIDTVGVMAGLCDVIKKMRGNIVDVQVLDRSGQRADQHFDVEITDLSHLQSILRELRALDSVISVERAQDSG